MEPDNIAYTRLRMTSVQVEEDNIQMLSGHLDRVREESGVHRVSIRPGTSIIEIWGTYPPAMDNARDHILSLIS